MDGTLSPGAIGEMIDALKRVPGVLLAEISPGTVRAIVAHDAAVTSTSLLEAAARTGAHLKLVGDTRVPAATGDMTQLLAVMPVRRLLMLAAALVFLPVVISAIFPGLATNHFLLPVLLSSVWAFVIVRAMFTRRP